MTSLEKRIAKCFSKDDSYKKDFVLDAFKKVSEQYSNIRTLDDDKNIEDLVRGVPFELLEDAFALYVLSFHKLKKIQICAKIRSEENEADAESESEKKADRKVEVFEVNTTESVEHIIRAAKSCPDDGLKSLREYADRYVRELLGEERYLHHTFIRHYTSAYTSSSPKQRVLLHEAMDSLMKIPHKPEHSFTDHPLLNMMYHWSNIVGMGESLPLWVELLDKKLKGRADFATYIKLGYQLALDRDKKRALKVLKTLKERPRLLLSPMVAASYIGGDMSAEFLAIADKLDNSDLRSWERMFEVNGNRKKKDEALGAKLYTIAKAKANGECEVGPAAVDEVVGDLNYKSPEFVDLVLELSLTKRATADGLKLAKRYRTHPDFKQRILLLSKLSAMNLSDDQRSAWVTAFDGIYRERKAARAKSVDCDHYEALDERILERIRSLGGTDMDSAVEGVSDLTRKELSEGASLERLVGSVACTSGGNKMSKIMTADVAGYAKGKYSADILTAIPVLANKLTKTQWSRAWKSIQCMRDEKKGTKTVIDPKKSSDKFAFVRNLCTALESTSHLDELLGELPSKSTDNVGRYAVIAAGCIEYERSLGWSALSELNNLLKTSEGGYHELFPAFKHIAEGLCGVSQADRPRILAGMQKIISTVKDAENLERLELAGEFVKAAKRSLALYADKFDEWVAQGIAHAGNRKDALHFLQDKDDYFTSRMESLVDGLRLSEVSNRLLTYVQALTGSEIEIQASEDDSLACRLEGKTFYLPSRVRVASDNDENYKIYRALASYQAGAVEFGTYDGDLSGFLDGFENRELALRILETVELARIGAQLRNKYAGLRKDLAFCDKVLLERVCEGSTQAKRLVQGMRSKVYGGSCDDTLAEIIDEARAGIDVESSFKLARKAYDLIALTWKDEVQEEFAQDSVLSINPAISAVGDGGVDFLVAEPDKQQAALSRFLYDEWDGQNYVRQHVQVFELALPARKNTYAEAFLAKNCEVVERLKRNFEMFRPQENRVRKRQLSGEIDMDRWIEAKAEMRLGITPSEKLFTRRYKDNPSVAAMVAAEFSGSLRNFVDLRRPQKVFIDLARDKMLCVSETLDTLGDSFALCGVSGETEKRFEFYTIKDFNAPYDASIRSSIGSLMPMKQSRDGAGIRHATAKLRSCPERLKLLFYLMEGVPQDFGYEGARAI